MARSTDAKCKKCRREGMKLFLKGERCLTEKCGVERRAYPPGQHGRGRIKQSEYLLQLREKQKAQALLRRAREAVRELLRQGQPQAGITGENLLGMLETRLDNVVYRLGFAASRAQARQLVRHGHFHVNGRRVNIPSFHVRPERPREHPPELQRRGGHSRCDRPHVVGRELVACRPRQSHRQGPAPPRACRDRHARPGAADRRALLQVALYKPLLLSALPPVRRLSECLH